MPVHIIEPTPFIPPLEKPKRSTVQTEKIDDPMMAVGAQTNA